MIISLESKYSYISKQMALKFTQLHKKDEKGYVYTLNVYQKGLEQNATLVCIASPRKKKRSGATAKERTLLRATSYILPASINTRQRCQLCQEDQITNQKQQQTNTKNGGFMVYFPLFLFWYCGLANGKVQSMKVHTGWRQDFFVVTLFFWKRGIMFIRVKWLG